MTNTAHLPRRERGVILFIALIVLVAMSLTGIALIRGVDTSVTVAGNLAFRQVATLAADRGVEQARTWLSSTTADKLYEDQPSGVSNSNGYWATMQSGFDLTASDPNRADFDWGTAVNLGADANGNTVQYVIHRMCDTVGNPANISCIRSVAGSGGGKPAGELKYGTLALQGVAQVLYRITTRVSGPRNTISYVQVMVM